MNTRSIPKRPGKIMRAYLNFKAEFCKLCESLGGVYSHLDTIGDGASYLFETKFGKLLVSIHGPMKNLAYERRTTYEFIFLRFITYNGPRFGPNNNRDEFNEFSWKWNLCVDFFDREKSRREVLSRLEKRLNAIRVDNQAETLKTSPQ